MAKTDNLKEYIWLVETIYEAKSITLTEINERWLDTEMSGGVEIARSTFKRHRQAIADIFGIHMDCNRKTNEYSIMNRNDLRDDKMANWLMTTLSVSNMLSDCVSLKDRILLESIPSEGWALTCVIEAMKKNRRLSMYYQKFKDAEPTERIVEPYCLKLYHRRWYMLCKDRGVLKMFAFDRIKDVKMTETRFRMDKDFSAEEYFSECFGVVNRQEIKAETVVLRATGKEVDYMKGLPIHRSQILLREGDDWAEFEVRLKPTDDFQGYVLGRAGWLKVTKPQWLLEEIKKSARRILEE